MSEDLSNADLAILGFDELRDLAKKNEISVTSNINRAAIVRLLRQHGIGNAGQSHVHTSSNSQASAGIDELAKTVQELVRQMSAIVDLKAEVESLRCQLADVSLKSQTHAPIPPTQPTGMPFDHHEPTCTSSSPSDPQHLNSTVAPAPRSQQQHLNPNAPVQFEQRLTNTRPLYSAQLMSLPHRSTPPPSFQRPADQTPTPYTHSSVTSYFHKTKKSTQGLLRGGSRVRCKALHVSNIDSGCHAEAIAKWCANKDVHIIKCSVAETRYFGLAYAHVVIPEEHFTTVQRDDFWPASVRVREWRFSSDSVGK